MVHQREKSVPSDARLANVSASRRREALRVVRRIGSLPGVKTIDGVLGPITESLAAKSPVSFSIESSQPPDSLGDVTLRMFEPFNQSDICALVRHYGGDSVGIFARMLDPVKHRNYEKKVKGRALEADPDRAKTYDTERAEELVTLKIGLKRSINQNVYSLIQKEFNLASIDQAAEKFETARQHADKAVSEHLELTHPELESDITRDWVKLPRLPADLLEMALTTEDKILRFELQRQFANTVLALQQERGRSVFADSKLSQIHDLLEAKLFTPSVQERHTTLYGEFSQDTNELVGRLYEGEPRTRSADSHFKALGVSVRPTQIGLEVMEEIGTKSEGAGVRKAVRKTIEDVQNAVNKGLSSVSSDGETPEIIIYDDTIRPAEKVRDTHRMTLVVLGGEKERNDLAEHMLEMILLPENAEFFYDRDVLGDVLTPGGEPTGGPTGDGEIKFENRGGKGQKEVNYVKLRVEFEHKPDPDKKPERMNIEILIQDAESFFREKYEVGEYDPDKDDFSGPAHGPYAVSREDDIRTVFTPKEVFPGLYTESKIRQTPGQVAAAGLLDRNRI